MMNKLDNIERLQKLKESGILTQEEFNIEKKKILNSDDSIKMSEERSENTTEEKVKEPLNIFTNIKNSFDTYKVFIIISVILIGIGLIIYIINNNKGVINARNEINIENELKIQEPKPSNDTVISCAKTALRNYAKYTPEIGTTKLIEEDEYGRYLVLCYAKLVNAFGTGKYRVYYIVLDEVYKKDGEWYYRINQANGIIDSSIYGDNEDLAKDSAKTLNQWNEPREDTPNKDDEEQESLKTKIDDTAESGAAYNFTLKDVESSLSQICMEKNINNFGDFIYRKTNQYNEVYESIAYINGIETCSIIVQTHNNYVVDLSYYCTYYEETEFSKNTGKEVYINLIQKLFDTDSEKITTAINKLTSTTFTYIKELNTVCGNYNDTEIFIYPTTYEKYRESKEEDNSALKTLFKEI